MKYPFILLSILLLIIPVFTRSNYILHVIIMCLIFSILTSCFDLSAGYTGIYIVCMPTFLGIGAYASALLTMKLMLSPWIGLLLGGLFATLFSVMVGAACIRVGDFGAVVIVTLAFAEAIRIIVSGWIDLTRGMLGLWGIPSFPTVNLAFVEINFGGASTIPNYYVITIIFLISLFILYRIANSPFGVRLFCIREDETASQAVGINTTKYKLLVFSISSFFAGIAGAFYAHYMTVLSPDLFSFDNMMMILAMMLIGGKGTLVGPVFAAFGLTILAELLRPFLTFSMLIFGAVILVTTMLLPQGVWEPMTNRLKKIFLKPVKELSKK